MLSYNNNDNDDDDLLINVIASVRRITTYLQEQNMKHKNVFVITRLNVLQM